MYSNISQYENVRQFIFKEENIYVIENFTDLYYITGDRKEALLVNEPLAHIYNINSEIWVIGRGNNKSFNVSNTVIKEYPHQSISKRTI